MRRKYRGGKGQNLPFIHNVRPAVELSGPPRWTALMMTAGLLTGLAALLIFIFQG